MINLRDYQQLSDSGPDFAGYDLGPTSLELQLGVLGSCLTHVFLIQAATLGIPLTALEMQVAGQIDPRAGRPGHEATPLGPQSLIYRVDLTSPAWAEEIATLHAAVETSCPISNLSLKPQVIRCAMERQAAGQAA